MKMTENSKIKVLLVDDDSLLLNVYVVKFKEHGMSIKVATSGDGAIKILKEGFDPNVVIADLVMPTMDGMEFLDAIRKEKLAADSATIFLTNQSDEESREKARQMGADGYIVKASMTPSEVLKRVLEVYGLYLKRKEKK